MAFFTALSPTYANRMGGPPPKSRDGARQVLAGPGLEVWGRDSGYHDCYALQMNSLWENKNTHKMGREGVVEASPSKRGDEAWLYIMPKVPVYRPVGLSVVPSYVR